MPYAGAALPVSVLPASLAGRVRSARRRHLGLGMNQSLSRGSAQLLLILSAVGYTIGNACTRRLAKIVKLESLGPH